SRAKLKEKEQAARESADVKALEEEARALRDRADALEAEAKALRQDANSVQSEIAAEIKQAVGPVLPFTETYDFQADEATDAELAGLSQHEVVNRLLAARGATANGIVQTNQGYWGDMDFMSLHPIIPTGNGWTRVGSPGWLEELFPGWNEERAAGPPEPA